jgi:hypothetical protein
MKCPNPLKTQSKCGEAFLGNGKKNLERWKTFSEKGEIATTKYSQ